ncbi:MAG: metallophosphoesterase [Pseudomonadales bacterium]|nr:metallophosphoesterase [Pseudomonadales bacterium]
MTRTTLTTIHTADLHLDNNIGARGKESAGQLGMMAVVDKALELDVDLFLLAGDLFDHNRVNGDCLEFASEQLARLRCPVVMVAGNHDCLADHSIYHRYDPCEAGDHIHFIRDESGGILELPSLGARVWGQGIVDHDPDNKPMESVPARDGDRWYIGLAHGYYVERGGGMV